MTDTDSGNRLSDAELAEIRARSFRQYSRMQLTESGDACGTVANPWEAARDVEALLSHIERLTANRGSVSEERAREVFMAKLRENDHDWLMVDDPTRKSAISAIQQAVSESSGQGTDGAEAMRDACVAYHTEQETLWDEISGDKAEELALFHQQAAFALQNLPLADGRDAVIEECALAASQYPTPVALAIAANIRALKSKQPSAIPEVFGVQPRSHRMSEGEK